MPTYEYQCQKCAHLFEQFQSIKDEPLKRCPKCKGKVRRLPGRGAGIIFKGSGFYETDYKRKSGGGDSGSTASSSSSSSSSTTSTSTASSTKTESKPAPKKDSAKSKD